MNINEMDLEQVETRMAEVKDMLHEDGADLDALETEIGELKTRKASIMAEIETRKAEINEVVETAAEIAPIEERSTKMENIEVRNTKEYINAYANYIKTGDDKACRALLTENVSGGTVAVPELVYDIVKNAWEKEGIMSLVKKTYIRGNLKIGFEISSTGATVHTESANSAVSEETLVLGIVNLVPASIKKWISLSDEVLDLAGEDFLRYIYDELSYQIAKKAADELVAKIKACPTASTTTCPSVPALSANAAVGTIAQAMALLSDQAANPVVIMNKATWGAFKTAQYAASYSIDPFEGLPVLFNNTLTAYSAATTGVCYAIVGDLGEGAIANFPNGEGINIKFDDLSKAEYDLVKVIGREYVALGVVAPDAFVQIKKA